MTRFALGAIGVLVIIAGLLVWRANHLAGAVNRAERAALEYQEAKRAEEKLNAELVAEISKRDSIIARRDVVNRKLSQRLRTTESAITQSTDEAVVTWRSSRIAGPSYVQLRAASHDEADVSEINFTGDPGVSNP